MSGSRFVFIMGSEEDITQYRGEAVKAITANLDIFKKGILDRLPQKITENGVYNFLYSEMLWPENFLKEVKVVSLPSKMQKLADGRMVKPTTEHEMKKADSFLEAHEIKNENIVVCSDPLFLIRQYLIALKHLNNQTLKIIASAADPNSTMNSATALDELARTVFQINQFINTVPNWQKILFSPLCNVDYKKIIYVAENELVKLQPGIVELINLTAPKSFSPIKDITLEEAVKLTQSAQFGWMRNANQKRWDLKDSSDKQLSDKILEMISEIGLFDVDQSHLKNPSYMFLGTRTINMIKRLNVARVLEWEKILKNQQTAVKQLDDLTQVKKIPKVAAIAKLSPVYAKKEDEKQSDTSTLKTSIFGYGK